MAAAAGGSGRPRGEAWACGAALGASLLAYWALEDWLLRGVLLV